MKVYLYKIYFIVLIIIPIVLLVLPADFFDYGNSVCLSIVLFERECFGCGMTRAIQHLIHLDFSTAYMFNKLSFIVLPLLIITYIKELIKLYKKFSN